jgi:GTP-binding protein Era
VFKSGYIAIIGRPNVGKSTLLNALLGQKIAAVCSKPQTTRHRILGIKHLPEGQLLFLDTPGIHKPHRSLNEYMVAVARSTFDDADLFLFLMEPGDEISGDDQEIYRMIRQKGKPILVVIGKADKTYKQKLLPLIERCHEIFRPEEVIPVSATTGDGLALIEAEILKRLPEGPPYFPPDQVTDQTERFLVAEIIREKVMELTKEEVPYSVTVQIEAFEEPPSPGLRPPSPEMGEGKKAIARIRASIITEKESQKGILIGKGGQMIKKIGELSRKEIEAELGMPVYLELFVRVEKDWSTDPKKVKEFAYTF